MSVETKPNKLVKGLVLDTFHTDVDNTVATYALNSQLEDQEGNHFHYGSEVGTTYIKEIPATHVVIGHINMERNETVLFTTDGTNSTIGILSRNDDMSYNYEIKVDDTKQTKKLGFKKEGYVRGVYRLLNGCDKVIYFVDGVNKDRRININQLDTYKLPTTASVASGIIFDDSLRATIFATSSASGNIQLIRLMSASPEATANVLANLSSGAELTKLLTASANGIGTALANLIRTANIVSSIEATGTSTVNVDIVRLLQSNVSAIGSVNAILQSSQPGLVEIDAILTGVASSTAILLRTALLEANISTQATTVVEAILTKVINAQAESSANTLSSAQISIPVNASATATATTAADAILSYAINASANAMAETSATAQLSKVITASANAAATSSSEALIGLVLVSTNTAIASVSTANLVIGNLLISSVTAEGTTTVETLIAKLLESSVTTSTNTTSDAIVSKLVSSSITAQADVTADSLVSKLLSSTVDGLATTTSNLQLADVLTTSVTGATTITDATLTTIVSGVSVDYLVVAGGGGGGTNAGGGGGAGGLKTNIGGSSIILNKSTAYTITVGGGGAIAGNGSNSVLSGSGITTVTATGGGAGKGFNFDGSNGGSGGGGGGGETQKVGGTGNSGEGNNGGNGSVSAGGLSVNLFGGGGGGAGSAGGAATTTSRGASGSGSASSITGSSLTYAAGGQGGGGFGGTNTGVGADGSVNTGNGGTGGGGAANGGAGGSGVVVIKIPNTYVAQFSSGCTVNGETSSVPFIPANLSGSAANFNTYNVTSTTTTGETVTFVSAADTDSNAAAFFTRVTTAGGTLTSTEQSAVDTLVKSLKSNGIWTKMKAIYPMVGASAAACRQNLKSASFTGTFTAGWTFASSGATPNGTSAFMDTGLNQSTNLLQTNGEIGAYLRTNIVGTYVDMGCYDTSDYSLITKLSDNDFYGRIASVDVNSNYQPPTTLGLFSIKANGANSAKFVRNGVIVATKVTTNIILSNLNIGIGAGINTSFPTGRFYSPRQTAFNYISDSLTDAENANLYTAVQAFQTSLSRQV